MKYDLAVIGSGPGGYVAAIRASQLGLNVLCVDKRKEPGGTCLNVGCIPSKALLHSSELCSLMGKEALANGLLCADVKVDFSLMQKRKSQIVEGFNQGVLSLFKKNKITYLVGEARLLSPTKIQVKGEEIEAKNILLATGSEPISLPFLPFDEKRILSSTGALALTHIPKNLIVIGAGIIGVELGSVYQRLGSTVTFIEFLDRICPTLDESLSKEFQAILTKQGLTFHLSSKVTGAEISEKEIILRLGDEEKRGDAVLICVGRRPFTKNLGLETVGIVPDSKGFIPVDGFFRTQVPSIFAIGDLIDGPMLAHKASEEGVAVAEILCGGHPQIDYLTIPNVVYTTPEVASVGLTELEVKNLNLSYKIGSFPFKINSRAQCTAEGEGFVKILAEERSDRILGMHILGPHASELICLGVLALKKRLTCEELSNLPYAHPTLSETIKEAALALHKKAIHR